MPDQPNQYEFLRPLVTGWLNKIDTAIRHKKQFTEVADQCMHFFSGTGDWMWQDSYRRKFTGGRGKPKFMLTISKAFELVALFGPVLYHRNPQRRVMPYKRLEYGPEIFGDPNDPMVQQQFQMVSSQDAREAMLGQRRAEMVELYLNYTPREQPDGGLRRHATDAITEALIKGRGVLWVEPFRQPGSNRMLTGSFFDSVDSLVIDPDAETFSEAKWIARRRWAPTWEVERRFRLPPGTLAAKAGQRRGSYSESAEAQSERRASEMSDLMRKRGESFDTITYWEVYSKGGCGGRLSGVFSGASSLFDDTVGDFCYLAVASDIPYPLNCSSEFLKKATVGEVKQRLDWPIPFHADGRWPCVVLDFYRQPNKVWPLAPLAPAIGELTIINIIMSHLVNRIWSTCRDFPVYLESVAPELEDVLKNGEDLAPIKLKDIHGDIRKVFQWAQQPQVNLDVWRILDALFELFDKRTGLTELLYALNPQGTQSRSASDIQVKDQKASVRPDYMADQVEEWLTEAARAEKMAAYWAGVRGQDLRPLLGQVGAGLWDQLVAQAPPELVIHEMDATVEANSVRKPNKQREQENMNQVMQVLLPITDKHADATTDTGPLNRLVDKWGDAIDQDMSAFQMGPRKPPPPPPEQQQMMQMQAAAEQQKVQADIANAQAQAEGAQLQTQGALAQTQAKLQAEAAKQQMDQARFGQEMLQDAAEHAREMEQDQEVHLQEMRQKREEGRLNVSQQQAMNRLKRIQARQPAAQGNGRE